MKKYIAIFSMLGLVLSVSFALAAGGNDVNFEDVDDSNAVFSFERSRELKVEQDAKAFLTNETNIHVVSGANVVAAGDDCDACQVDSGDSELTYDETSDVNGLVVAYTSDEGSEAENELDGTDLDDSNLVMELEDEEEEEIEADSEIYEDNTFNADVVSGSNVMAAGGDIGEDLNSTNNSGNATATVIRTLYRGFVQITRL